MGQNIIISDYFIRGGDTPKEIERLKKYVDDYKKDNIEFCILFVTPGEIHGVLSPVPKEDKLIEMSFKKRRLRKKPMNEFRKRRREIRRS